MKNLLLLMAMSLLCSCHFANSEVKKDTVIECCGGLSLTSLHEDMLVSCGISYSGNAVSRRVLEKSNLNKNKIISCAKRSKDKGKSFIVQFELKYMPDLEVSTFAIFEPDGKGILVRHQHDVEANSSVSVEQCSHLILSKSAEISAENCVPSLELKEKLAGKK